MQPFVQMHTLTYHFIKTVVDFYDLRLSPFAVSGDHIFLEDIEKLITDEQWHIMGRFNSIIWERS